MPAQFNIHGVARIQVKANSALSDAGSLCWWQDLVLFNSKDEEIGAVVLFLTRPDVALPVGDQPPYFGALTNPPAQMPDGEVPF